MCFSKWFGKNKELGEVVHYFDKIQVIVVALKGKIKVGDKVKIKRSGEEFEETVNTMQINHVEVAVASKGEEVAIKISRPTKAGAKIYKA